MIENRKKFDQLSESSFFTYQDEAGVHLCIVKQRVNLDALLIFELSTSQNKKLLTTENFSDFNDSRVFTYYEFDPNHCLNLCNFAERGPTKDEMRITNERSKLESHYDRPNLGARIWHGE